MTPELAQKYSEMPTDPELYTIMSDVYDRFKVEDIALVIAKIRAEITLANLSLEISK